MRHKYNKSRREAIQEIMKYVDSKTIIVSSVGMTSRELYRVKDRHLNFYLVGGMGGTLAISLGLALNLKRKVIAISGEGDALMSLGTFVLHNKLAPKNLWHFVLDNNEYASTGGQPTCSDAVNFNKLAPNTITIKIDKGKGDAPRIPLSPVQIKERFMNAIKI